MAGAGLALVCAGAGAAADGGSGTYAATGMSYAFNLFNAGTTAWQYFYLVGPSGTVFVGGATIGEITVRCVPGQPDGQADEIECGPISATGLQPNTHVGFVATLGAAVTCGAPFQLDVSSTGVPPFTRVGDATFSGSCTPAAPHALTPPALRGTPTVGSLLTATSPTWSAPPTRVAYQWQLCTPSSCRPIKGATRLTLKITRSDAGHSVRFVATATIAGSELKSFSRTIAVRAKN